VALLQILVLELLLGRGHLLQRSRTSSFTGSGWRAPSFV
jgi:hypothetical protein